MKDNKLAHGLIEARLDKKLKFSIGDIVATPYLSQSGRSIRKLVAGEVVRINSDGSFVILYENGVTQKKVKQASMVLIRKGNNGADLRYFDILQHRCMQLFDLGDKVVARFKQGEVLYPGSPVSINMEKGTYAIQYDDGDFEENVDFFMVSPRLKSSRAQQSCCAPKASSCGATRKRKKRCEPKEALPRAYSNKKTLKPIQNAANASSSTATCRKSKRQLSL